MERTINGQRMDEAIAEIFGVSHKTRRLWFRQGQAVKDFRSIIGVGLSHIQNGSRVNFSRGDWNVSVDGSRGFIILTLNTTLELGAKEEADLERILKDAGIARIPTEHLESVWALEVGQSEGAA